MSRKRKRDSDVPGQTVAPPAGDDSPQSEFSQLKDDSATDLQAEYEASHRAQPALDPEPAPGPSSPGPFEETPPKLIEAPARKLKLQTRRDFVLFGIGGALAAAAFWEALPIQTETFHRHDASLPDRDLASAKERILNESLTFDDAVAEALYSPTRPLPTYDRSKITPNLRNNYNGATPDPGYLDGWTLTIAGNGLAGGVDVVLDAHTLRSAFTHHDQITRLVCVEGWSAIAWWGGVRFAELLERYPPKQGYAWASLGSSVNLDADGNSDPYYVSLDLSSARHPQTLLATHNNGQLLDVDHGAPLRLVAPMKLGLKNIKAITSITYTLDRPADYWGRGARGYSQYDGI